MLTKFILGYLILPAITMAAGGVTVINVGLDQVLEAPRWMYDSKAKVKAEPLIKLMVDAKGGLMAKDRARCLAALQKAFGMGRSLGPWLTWNQLQCAQLRDKKDVVHMPALAQAIARLEAQPNWLLFDPSSGPLKTAYTGALLALAEAQVKSDRRAAWKTLDRLQQVRPWLSPEERAKNYKWAGELSFIEQNLLAAQDFLLRSLNEKESAELRERVASIRTSLPSSKKASEEKPTPKGNEDLGISDNEKEVYTRMNRAYDSQDYLSAIEDGVELIQKYPGSRRAIFAADRVLDIYLSVANRREEKFRHVRESVVKEMSKVDGGRLYRWANNAYASGNYVDALNLAEKSFTKLAGHPDAIKMLLLAGKAGVACGEFSDAFKHFDRLLNENGGTPEATEATFRLGLLHFRGKKYGQAAAYFERLLALGGNKDFEYRGLYWQWRAQQKINAGKAGPFAEALLKKYPLTYYGLRAQAELNQNQLSLKRGNLNVKAEYHFLESERLAWERLNILLKAGWLKEAEKELEVLPAAQSGEEYLVRAKLWASTMRYDLAVQNVNKALDDNPEWLQHSILKIVYPKEYGPQIAREGKAQGLSEDWIRSLIRQESTFRPDAKSTSNALGVMQLIPATAQDMATETKTKDFQLPESLFDPEINIKLGTTYLARMVRSFNGHVPLALAAYNAGPTRLRRWLAARKDMSALETIRSSDPEVELWIDELPWEETSFYVKAILRNWLIYGLLEGSKVTLTEPIWMDANASAR